MLGDANVDEHGNVLDNKDHSGMYLDKDCEDREINVLFNYIMPIYFKRTFNIKTPFIKDFVMVWV